MVDQCDPAVWIAYCDEVAHGAECSAHEAQILLLERAR
jgi:hypothetical protein